MNEREQLPTLVMAALKRGDSIEAVRLLREAGGLGLRDALAALDTYARQQASEDADDDAATPAIAPVHGSAMRDAINKNVRTPTVVEGDHGGHGAVLFALAIAVVAVAWWWIAG